MVQNFPKIKQLCLLLAYILIPFAAFSQHQGYFTGRVLSDYNNGPLVGANIKMHRNASVGTATDRNGNFFLSLKPGNYQFIVSYTGMETDTVNVSIHSGDTTRRTIKLKFFVSNLAPVEVKVGRLDQKPEDLTVSMEIIDIKQIESKNSTNIKTVLKDTPGLNILDGEPQIRGGSGFTFGVGSKVGLFVDGMPALSGDANRPLWDFIPLENIKQIEVIKGASSVLSGSASLSGAIYVRTEYPGLKPVTKFRVYSGFYNAPKYKYMKWWKQFPYIAGTSFLHSRMIKNTDLVIGGNIKFDHGYEGPPVPLPTVVDTITDFNESQMAERSANLNFKIRHRNKKYEGFNYGVNGNFQVQKTKLMVAWLDDSAGFYRAYPRAVVLQDKFLFYLDPFVNYYSPLGFKHSLKTRVMYNNNQMSNNQMIKNTVIFTDYSFRRDYPSLNDLKFIGGFSTQYTSSYSNIYIGSGSPYNRHFNLSGYTEVKVNLLDMLKLTGGFRLEYNTINHEIGNLKTIFRVGASFKLLKETYLRMSLGQGYRYPTIAERYIRISMGTFGAFDNPDLIPETSVNAELGIKQGFKFKNYFGYLDVAFFQQDYKNTIEYLFGFWDSTYTFAIAGFKFVNTGRSRIVGVDISVTGRAELFPGFYMNTVFGYNYIMPKSLDPNYVFAQDFKPGGNHTDFTFLNTSVDPDRHILKYRFLHSVKANLEFEYKGFSPGFTLRYFSKLENLDKSIEDFENATKAAGGSLQPIEYMNYYYNENNGNVIMDLRLAYSFGEKYKVSVTANNLLNRWYSLRPLKAEPMRSILFQFSYKI